MERETLVALLTMIFGGLVLQALAGWAAGGSTGMHPSALERHAWLAVCSPLVPVLVIAAWLVGWAFTQPDPVTGLDPFIVLAVWLPFGFLFARATVRAVWALVRDSPECGVSTFGFLQPQVVFSPFLARRLDEPVIRAALAHEHAHARHRDPLRIWVAQFITDLQWPWPQAQRRLTAWLAALELARDEEARRENIEGADLAAAVLASVRFLGDLAPRERRGLGGTQLVHARLIGEEQTLQYRVSRLLAPSLRAETTPGKSRGLRRRLVLMVPLLLLAMMLGIVYGPRIMHPLLGLTL